MIYAPIPIKKPPYCAILYNEDFIEDYNIYNGIVLKNNIINRTKSLNFKKKKNKKYFGHGKATKFNNLSNVKHILYIKNNNIKKFYLTKSNELYNCIDNQSHKFLITKLNNHKFKICDIIHTINKRM